jgi:hypothetical protein
MAAAPPLKIVVVDDEQCFFLDQTRSKFSINM